jgi:hypothetical protein
MNAGWTGFGLPISRQGTDVLWEDLPFSTGCVRPCFQSVGVASQRSSLMLGYGEPGGLYTWCVRHGRILAIITAYLPDPSQWSEDFRRRR